MFEQANRILSTFPTDHLTGFLSVVRQSGRRKVVGKQRLEVGNRFIITPIKAEPSSDTIPNSRNNYDREMAEPKKMWNNCDGGGEKGQVGECLLFAFNHHMVRIHRIVATSEAGTGRPEWTGKQSTIGVVHLSDELFTLTWADFLILTVTSTAGLPYKPKNFFRGTKPGRWHPQLQTLIEQELARRLPGFVEPETEDNMIDKDFNERNKDALVTIDPFVRQMIASLKAGNNLIVRAPVKSGKRIMAQWVSHCSRAEPSGPFICNSFLTALKRVDSKHQLEEMRDSHLTVFETQKDWFEQLQKHVEARPDNLHVFHVDESDYGTGTCQQLEKMMNLFRASGNILLVLYSATNEEAVFSEFAQKHPSEILTYASPPEYRGAKWYLEKKLVHDATQFFDFTLGKLTEQGEECVSRMDDRHYIGVVRLSGNVPGTKKPAYALAKAKNSNFQKELARRGIVAQFVDGTNHFDWGEGGNWMQFHGIPELNKKSQRVIFVINQTCTRSTEVRCLPFTAFWHDFRRESAAFNTMAQAFLRVAHYEQMYQPIIIDLHLYCYEKVIKAAADVEDGKNAFKEFDRAIAARVKQSTRGKHYRTEIIVCDKDTVLEEIRTKGRIARWVSKNDETDMAHNIFSETSGREGSDIGRLPAYIIDKKNTFKQKHITSFEQMVEKLDPTFRAVLSDPTKYLVALKHEVEGRPQPVTSSKSIYA